jgi:hypothetical protein
MNIFNKRKQVGIPLAKDGLVSALKEMTHGQVFPVKVHRIALIDALKYFRKGHLSHFHQKMNMVRHQNIGIEEKGITILVAL